MKFIPSKTTETWRRPAENGHDEPSTSFGQDSHRSGRGRSTRERLAPGSAYGGSYGERNSLSRNARGQPGQASWTEDKLPYRVARMTGKRHRTWDSVDESRHKAGPEETPPDRWPEAERGRQQKNYFNPSGLTYHLWERRHRDNLIPASKRLEACKAKSSADARAVHDDVLSYVTDLQVLESAFLRMYTRHGSREKAQK